MNLCWQIYFWHLWEDIMKNKQLKALLKKDLIIHKNMLLLPIWITLGFYFLNFITFIIAYFRNDITIFNNIDINEIETGIGLGGMDMIGYIINYSSVLVPTALCGIVLIYLSQKALNEDKHLHYDFFHRSQPVDESLMILSKTVIIVVGLWFTTIVLSLFNFILANWFLVSKLKVSLSYSFVGYFQSLIITLISFFFIGSLLIFCSSIFKKAAFLKLFSVLIVIKILFSIFERFYKWNLPDIVELVLGPVMIPIKYIFTKELRYMNLNDIVEHVNGNILSMESLLMILAGIAFLVGSYFIYKNSEIAN